MIFRARQFKFDFPRPALIMGIVNVTPDSFSDGGRFLDPDRAVAHARRLAAEGADILDIGGESTRPGAVPVPEAEELRRVVPVIQALAPRVAIPISIDTMKPAVARAALAAGASIVNDVAAGRGDAALWGEVAAAGAGYVCLHASPGGPAGRGEDREVVRVVAEFFLARMAALASAGIRPEQTVFDPGIGFGKTLDENLRLLANLRSFKKLGRPVLLGVSRKSFIGKLSGAAVNERLPASLACATLAVASGVQIIRAHDVAETVQAVRLAEAVLAQEHN